MPDNPQVYKDIMDRLDAIGKFIAENAAKGIQFGFETMFRQEFFIHGILRAVMFSLFIFFGLFLYYQGRKFWRQVQPAREAWAEHRAELREKRQYWRDEDLAKAAGSEPDETGAVLLWIASAISSAIGFFGVWNGVAHAINPGFYVIQTIIELLKLD